MCGLDTVSLSLDLLDQRGLPISLILRCPQDPQEERRAGEGGDDPDRDLLRGEDDARDDIRHEQGGRAAEDAERDQPPVIGTKPKSDEMRNDESDKADDAGKSYSGGSR